MNSPLPPPGLEPTLYFFSNSLTVIAIAGLVFFVLGLWFGYLTWGRFKRRSRAYMEETNLLRLEIAKLKRRIAEDVVAPSPVVAHAPVIGRMPAPEIIMLDQTSPVVGVASPSESIEASEIKHEPEPEPVKETLAAIVGVPPIVPAMPDQVVQPASETVVQEPVVEPALVLLPPPEEILPPSEREPSSVVDEVAAVPAITVAETSPPEVPLPVPDAADVPDTLKADESAPAAPTELAARLFADELKTGTVRCDSHLGIVYGERPDRWDDLTLMRGVAELTQQRLHEFGIFTFKQIASWDERVTRGVGMAIHAKDRIGRERWPQQASDLHYLKYGEKIA